MTENTIFHELKSGLSTHSAEDTMALGERLARAVPENCTLALYGDLGVGKTTLVKGIAKGMGVEQTVTSPTFNLFSIYQGRRQFLHLDAYRLKPTQSIESLMIDDFLEPPYCLLIEWPDHVPALIDLDTVKLKLSIVHPNPSGDNSGEPAEHRIQRI